MLRKIDPTLEKINGAFWEGSEESQKYNLMHWIWWLGAKGERLGVEYSAEALCGPKDRMDWSFLYSILEGFGFDQVVHFGMPVLSTPQWQPSWILPFSHKVYDRAIPSRYFFSSLLITTLAYSPSNSRLTGYQHGGSTLVPHLSFIDVDYICQQP